MVCESLGVSLGAETSWSSGQCPCWSCLWDTVLGVEGCTGHDLGVLKKIVCVFWEHLAVLRHHSCKARAGALYREGEQSKMFCSFLGCFKIKQIY